MNPNFSPADSLLSASGDTMTPLFHDQKPSSHTIPQAMTPRSFDGAASSRDASESPEEESKSSQPTKKRKSWGQELPTPKTNLPPRKRAKTEDEKEQRRIERVLRNRAAAHSSRERKRKEVESLESEKLDIERENSFLRTQNSQLAEQLAQVSAQMAHIKAMMATGTTGSSASDFQQIATDPIVPTVKHELDALDLTTLTPPPHATVDPRESSFSSPGASPIVSATLQGPSSSAPSGLTQHPAAMLCTAKPSDLQCQPDAARTYPSFEATTIPHPTNNSSATPLLFLTTASAIYSRLTAPLALIFSSLKNGTPLGPQISQTSSQTTTLILWLISATTRSTQLQTSTSTHPFLRLQLLRRLLACSPALARPLRAATARALQQTLRSDYSGSTESGSGYGPESSELELDLSFAPATLLTIMWALDSLEKERCEKEMRLAITTNHVAQDPATEEVHRLSMVLDSLMETARGSEVGG